jgi:hypothetical protein
MGTDPGGFDERKVSRQSDNFRRFRDGRQAESGTDFSFVYAAIAFEPMIQWRQKDR